MCNLNSGSHDSMAKISGRAICDETQASSGFHVRRQTRTFVYERGAESILASTAWPKPSAASQTCYRISVTKCRTFCRDSAPSVQHFRVKLVKLASLLCKRKDEVRLFK